MSDFFKKSSKKFFKDLRFNHDQNETCCCKVKNAHEHTFYVYLLIWIDNFLLSACTRKTYKIYRVCIGEKNAKLPSVFKPFILIHWASFSAWLNSLKIPGMIKRRTEKNVNEADNHPAAVNIFQYKLNPISTPSLPRGINADWITLNINVSWVNRF